MKHKHKYIIIEQEYCFGANINIYKCKCGKNKVEYEAFGNKVRLRPDFYKKQGKELNGEKRT